MAARQPANGHRAAHPPADWAVQYQPDPRTPLRTCGRCGARYLDDEPGRRAHVAVFAHSPRPPEPAKTTPPQEGPDHAST